MHLQSIAALAALALSVRALPAAQPNAEPAGDLVGEPSAVLDKRQTRCSDGVVVFGLRGSSNNTGLSTSGGEWYTMPDAFITMFKYAKGKVGPGSSGLDSYITPIVWPDTNPQAVDPNGVKYYDRSVQAGVISLQDTVTDYVNNCPAGQIVIIGYSQGAQVVQGALAGYPAANRLALTGKANTRINAVILLADPEYSDNYNPIDQGSGSSNGANGVLNNPKAYSALNAYYGARLRSYCQSGDQFCDSGFGQTGTAPGDIHQNAPDYFVLPATQFMLSVLKKMGT